MRNEAVVNGDVQQIYKQEVTRALAAFAVETTWNDIQPVLEVLENGLLDYIGLVSFAAQNVESSEAFFKAVKALSTDGPGTVIGSSFKCQAQYAALLNGTLAHSMDCDDTHIGSALHPGAPVISAALAQAELEANLGHKISGRALFEAIAVGYEIMCRLGNCISGTLHRVGFHPTGVLGVIGGAAAAGRLASFGQVQMEALFGIVSSMASGSMQYLENGAWNKRLHPGLSAHNALLGVQFVKSGVVGATKSLEGQYGILNAYGRQSVHHPEIIQDLRERWEAKNTAIKPYASCRLTHAAIDAVYHIRKNIPVVPDVEIEVCFSRKSYMIVGSPTLNKVNPENIVDAQFSIYYHVAVAWLYGHNDWTAYEYLRNKNVCGLSHKITVSVDDDLPDESLATVVKIGGITATVNHPIGEPQNPLPLLVVEGKFLQMAEKVYGRLNAEHIVSLVDDLKFEKELTSFMLSLAL